MSDAVLFGDVQAAAVLATFPGSRLTHRRTPERFKRFWDELTRQAEARTHAEMVAAATLERANARTR